MNTEAAAIPEQGQLVKVRHRYFLVQDVVPGNIEPRAPPVHRVHLECLDADQHGDTLDVVWENEIHKEVHEAIDLPKPEQWDTQDRFNAFILATRWTLSSVLEGLPLQAPFRGDIKIEDYQIEPVVRALRMPRVSLLIADGVGIGKTIEAGLVLQELIARQRVRKALILCPSSLQQQWADEMRNRFALTFEILDRNYIHRIRREYGVHVNPWASYPRLITSMDFLKREAPLTSFRASLKSGHHGALKDWDILIVDEAHNLSPSGRKTYVRDSDRTLMLREIKDFFEHRLFLTATPHNGFTESFSALLEMLDPIRFSRGPEFDKDQLKTVMIRRLKDSIHDALGRRVFPKREVVALPVALDVADQKLFGLLDQYMELRLGRLTKKDTLPVRFALIMLKRRLLSSPGAFDQSIKVHHSHLQGEDAPDADTERVIQGLQLRVNEDHDSDEEKDQAEETALVETARYFAVTPEELQLVEKMKKFAGQRVERADAKAEALFSWIRSKLNPDGGWNQDRVLLFTEFRDTLQYLCQILESQGWKARVLSLYGGMPGKHREEIKDAFRSLPDDSRGVVRILVATDAAAEGLNLQEHCRYLIHYDIPWNPNRMEQRNGRIDRHGQNAEEVFCHHFVFQGREDFEFLQTVIDKVQTMRDDLGAVGDVIAEQVEEAMLGQRRTLDVPRKNVDRIREEVKADVVQKEQIRELQRAWMEAKRLLELSRENMKMVIQEALSIEGQGELLPVEEGELKGKGWYVHNLPASWSEVRSSLTNRQGMRLKAIFDEHDGRNRRDTVLIHLDHPLMKRALAVYRANLWATGIHESQQLYRVSYRVVPESNCDRLVIIAFCRLVCVSTQGQRLHEEIFLVGGEIQQREIVLLEEEALRALLTIPASFPNIPKEVGIFVRQYFPFHQNILKKKIEAQGKIRETLIRKELKQKGTTDARIVRTLIDQRIKEITKNLETMAGEVQPAQLSLWPKEQVEQHDSTVSYLKRRLQQLQNERQTEPEHVKARYEIREPRSFPLGLLYLIPENLVEARN